MDTGSTVGATATRNRIFVGRLENQISRNHIEFTGFNPKQIKEIHVELEGLDQLQAFAFPTQCIVGALLKKHKVVCDRNSFVIRVAVYLKDGTKISVHESFAYMVKGCVILADASALDIARGHGFHAPVVAVRCMYPWVWGGLAPERILALPKRSGL